MTSSHQKIAPLAFIQAKKSHGAHDQIMFFWGVSKGYKLNGLLHKTIILVEIYFINNSGGLLFYWSGLTSTGFILFCSPAKEKKLGLGRQFGGREYPCFFLPNAPDTWSLPHSRETSSGRVGCRFFFLPHRTSHLRRLQKWTQSQRGDRKEPQRPFFTVLSLCRTDRFFWLLT